MKQYQHYINALELFHQLHAAFQIILKSDPSEIEITFNISYQNKENGSISQYLSCKVFRDWSIINIWEINHIY